MIDVKTAMSMVESKYPNKKLRGNPFKLGDLLLFWYVDKTATEDEAKWDNRIIGVNAMTGEMSTHSFLDEDIAFGNTEPITDY